MLVLSRKAGSSLMIGSEIELTVLEITNDVVKIGIKAPKEISILRKELYIQVENTNRSAETSIITQEDLLKQFKELKNAKKL